MGKHGRAWSGTVRSEIGWDERQGRVGQGTGQGHDEGTECNGRELNGMGWGWAGGH